MNQYLIEQFTPTTPAFFLILFTLSCPGLASFFMYHFDVEFLAPVVSVLKTDVAGCNCTV
jgi:hypothetical protein